MRWGAIAAAAEGAFLVLWAAAEALPGQSPQSVTVSGLVLGSLPWIITAAFFAHAGSLAALAARLQGLSSAASAVRREHPRSAPARPSAPGTTLAGHALRWAAWAVGVAAVGMLLVALFPVGPGPKTVHFVGAWLAFGGLASSAGMAAVAGKPLVRWLGIVVVVGTAALLASTFLGLFPVFERIQLLLNGAWIFAVAAPRAFSMPVRSQRP